MIARTRDADRPKGGWGNALNAIEAFDIDFRFRVLRRAIIASRLVAIVSDESVASAACRIDREIEQVTREEK